MAGIDVVTVQDIVLGEISSTFANYEVIEDGVLNDEYLLKQNNIVKPYIVVQHGGAIKSRSDTSFAGARYDSFTTTTTVSVVAPRGRQVRQVLNAITDALTGFTPTGGSELKPYITGGPWTVYNSSGTPHVFTGSVMFDYAVDTDPETNVL